MNGLLSRSLPSGRCCVASIVLGALFTFVTLRLTLGSAGMTPPLTVPSGLLSYVLLRALKGLQPNSLPFTATENAVAATMATSAYKIVGFAGYGSYLTALSYPIYLQMGGQPKGQPGYDASAVVDPDLYRVYPYLVLIAFGGIFVLLSLRVLLIIKWRLPFPSGTASGLMINSLHQQPPSASLTPAPATALAAAAADSDQLVNCHNNNNNNNSSLQDGSGEGHNSSSSIGLISNNDCAVAGGSPAQLASRKVKVLAYTALGSFLFDAFKWLFQGPNYACGFATWPTFGFAAAQWTWRFDFMQQYIGSGFLVPHIVAWSMLLGAIISWGIMWPQLSAHEGDWYPAGLSFSDMRGLAGYKIFLSVALLLGEGAFIMVKAAMLGFQHLHAKHSRRHTHAHRPDLDDLSSSSSTGDDSGCGGAGAGSSIPLDAARQQDLQRPLSISTSCSLRCSLDTAASSDMRLRNTLAAAGCGSATTSCQQQLQWQLQQQQQLQRLEEGQEVPADAQAVFCDEPGSEKGRAAADAAWVSKDVEAGQGRTAGGSTGIRNRGGARRAQRDDRQGGRVTAGLDGDEGFAGATFRETAQERCVREAVFLSDVIPSWLGPAGYCFFAVLGTACIPLVYPPARWYMVLVAFLLGPPVALANGFGSGLTDVDNSANYAVVAMFLFAAWAAATGGNGIIAGCIISGVLMVFSVSAAVLLQDLRTGYITLATPSSLLVAQVLGAAFGVLFSPLAFALFWRTGQVGRADGPYPAPFASVTRGMASIGVLGFGALPRYCGLLSIVFFVAAFGISAVRDFAPVRYGRWVPSPMAMAFPFFIPASNALDFWVGSVIVMLWTWKAPESAEHYAPLAGAGLLVGDGLWAIPSAILAIANVAPPMCMKFE